MICNRSAALAVFCILFIAGDLPFLKLATAAEADELFYVATSGRKTHFFATIFSRPMNKRDAGLFCTSRGMALASMTTKGPNRLLHLYLQNVVKEETGLDMEPTFWAAGYAAGNHCRYAYMTKNYLGTAWTDCDQENMRLGVCVMTGDRA